ncbi:hypothetical protein [Thalassotalea fusca]
MKPLLIIVALFFCSSVISSEPDTIQFIMKHDVLKELDVRNLSEVIWNKEMTALAFCTKEIPNKCYVVDSVQVADVTALESANLGKLGLYSRQDYQKIISFPHKWLRTEKDFYLVSFKTQAWRNGQRYTVKEPALVENGKYQGR